MRKQRIEYDSSLDALVSVTKRLSAREDQYHLTSEEFYDKFCKGQMEDSIEYVEWSNDYQHYMSIRFEIERLLRHVA